VLNDDPVTGITAFLTPPAEVSGTPERLQANERCSFTGCKVYGQGFVITPEQAQSLIAKDTRSKDVLFPYLDGEDVNSRHDQSPSRCVINFFDWPLPKAKEFTDCFRVVENYVKPERMILRDTADGKRLKEKWWLYGRSRPELYGAIAGTKRVLVGVLHTKYWSVAFYPPSIVFSHALAIFSKSDFATFSVLESFVHESWAREYSSSLETRMRYTPSDCFETFPFPVKVAALDGVGQRYYEHRQRVMLTSEEGLTKTYNRFHDPDQTDSDIQKLRELHVEMDKAVAAAYGWTDLDLGHDFHKTKQGLRFTISEAARREVLGGLLKLNHERYAEEVKQGLHDKKGKKPQRGQGLKKVPEPEGDSLFGVEEENDTPAEGAEAESERQPAKVCRQVKSDGDQHDEASQPTERPTPIEEIDTDDVMAAFRQAARGRGWMEREELLKLVSVLLGYQRLGPKIEEVLRDHLRAAIRRKIIEAEGQLVRPGTTTMADYGLDELREVFATVMRKGPRYEREEVINAIARTLGFARVTDTSRDAIKSALNSGIRQGILGYEGSVIWREA